jgi:hypothetical protein
MKCEYCSSTNKGNDRGQCLACGAPIKIVDNRLPSFGPRTVNSTVATGIIYGNTEWSPTYSDYKIWEEQR